MLLGREDAAAATLERLERHAVAVLAEWEMARMRAALDRALAIRSEAYRAEVRLPPADGALR